MKNPHPRTKLICLLATACFAFSPTALNPHFPNLQREARPGLQLVGQPDQA